MISSKFLIILILLNIYKSGAFELNNEFIIQSNNKNFLAQLSLKEKIQITMMEIEIVSSSYHYIELTLESLCKYNKIFKQYDTLEDAYNCIKKLFEKEKIKIYNNDNNISLGFIMNSASCDNEEVIVALDEIKMNKDEINDKVRKETNILRNKIKTLEEEIKELKSKIDDYDSRLSCLELKNENIDTKIITKKSELMFIKDILEEKYNIKTIKFYNKYRSSRDGKSYDIFNSILKNNNYRNLLLLFHTTKGLKFGLFLNDQLKYNNYYGNHKSYGHARNKKSKKNNNIESENIIFSINNNKIFNIENYDEIICFNNNCLNNKESQCLLSFCDNNLLNSQKNMDYINKLVNNTFDEMKGGEKYFYLKEIEVFMISHNNYGY